MVKEYKHLEVFTEEEIWKQYSDTKDRIIRNYFIEKYAPLVKYVAGRVMVNIPSSVDFQDLVSFGVIGLIDAIDKFDLNRDIKFKTYAVTRIRGAIFDELRNLDWLPRSVRQKAKEIERTIAQLELKLGRSAKDHEIAQAMGVSIEEFHQLLLRVGTNALISIDDNWSSHDGNDNSPMTLKETLENKSALSPNTLAEHTELKKMIAQAIADLPDREKQVLILYYYEELTLKEIGSILSVTESRVSQLHTKAIMRLRGKLNQIKQGLS
ncbi:MAG: RNA polymerase sigma factor WhiG [Brevinemataceae bacterium]